ncbi:hypothetical protein AURANDRAFT_65168 [Aureococcus anophagefferens]|uniref:SAM domain-containing protein n=1 Tax=Aureococcus anophagefferens TaxID=44056 RepID=F0YCY0_AURAN|nr:hypothetical protein AURANDRAFT_65168 [Aureococcus anophagefferens]EGB06964.1 hypothetical protein AURANDRAFT_65168 [Aureococcus anophagefferens]|eukprot:XP_009038205.1 hypothetical protein AURANDRAFT_65168 [Aureococcus anophagefferens]
MRGGKIRAPPRGGAGGETERLAAEAQQMSDKLNALRAQMSREKQKREAAETTRGVGGARWGSSGGDRGGIRAYGREAREKAGATNRAPRAARPARSPAAGDRAAAAAAAPPRVFGASKGYWSRPVAEWSVADAADWLETTAKLPQYAAVFAANDRAAKGCEIPNFKGSYLGRFPLANEIGGAELLDLGLDDLDYLEIKALAHRKKLLKGVAELNVANRNGQVLRALSRGDDGPPTGLDGTSPLKPASVPADGRGPSPRKARVGGALGAPAPKDPFAPGDAYEALPPSPPRSRRVAAEVAPAKQPLHWSAAAPLAETQVSGGALDVNGGDRAPRGLLDGAGAAGGWSNPADLDVGGGSSLLLDEQAEQEAFKRAVEEWRSGGKENVAAESPTKPAFAPEQSLLNGTFDEAAEQRSFKEAVMSWRTGGDSPPKQAPPVARVASGDGSPSKLGKSAREVAEDLERRLDALHAAQARDLQDRKDAAAKKLAAATLEADEPAPAPDVAEESDDDLALDPADASDYEEDDDDEPVLHQSAHVSLVASQLGGSADAEDLGYVVEEEDD